MIYPENFEHKIDFVKVRELVKEHCLSELGKDLVGQMHFLDNYSALHLRLVETQEFTLLLESGEEFPTDHYFDLRTAFAKMRVSGTFLYRIVP